MPDNLVIRVNTDSKGGKTRINWHYMEQIVIKYFSIDLKILFTEKSEKGHYVLENIYRKVLLIYCLWVKRIYQ